MIEWLFIGGAVLVGSLLDAKDKKRTKNADAGHISLPPQSQLRSDELEAWRKQWSASVDRERWIPYSKASRILEEFPLPPDPMSARFGLADRSAQTFTGDLLDEFREHNLNFLAAQKKRLRSFFDTVEKDPLTDEQADACICMDDAVQVVAAAGSGKTSTMVAKTGYVLHEGLASPHQILLLAFNRDAVEELRARLKARLSSFEHIGELRVETFHSFGSSIITQVNDDKKPSVAGWLGTNKSEVAKILSIVAQLRTEDPRFGIEWDFFRTVYGRDIGDSPTASELNDSKAGSIFTANGEWVKSEEERLIADWLFYHGVNYAYERDYEHDTRTEHRRQYRPDFFYPEIQLYHEHFALDQHDNPPPSFGNYREGVEWKRECHSRHNTDLIETKSYQMRSGEGFENLKAELIKRGLEPRYDGLRQAKGRAPISDTDLAGLVRSFQQHIKGGAQSIGDVRRRIEASGKRIANSDRISRFIAIYERIASEWERQLEATSSIDFDDMLIEATEHLESGRFKSPFMMIFSDEFQDSSHARLRLLKALLDQTDHQGHLCVVGDDWQSINRFAGADISVMSEFSATFPYSSQLKLTTTFRCPAALCEASSTFVTANPRQLEKVVQTTNRHNGPAIAAFAYSSSEEGDRAVYRHLKQLHRGTRSKALEYAVTVLLLGRYRRDEPAALDKWRADFGDRLSIEFKTVHGAKGLEADYVFILSACEGEYGFPSQIADDPILHLAMPTGDDYPMAEERRVFYVALTRAKRQVRIYTSIDHPSRFLTEMAKGGLIEIRLPQGRELEFCPKCKDGTLMRRQGPYGVFDGCNRCDYKRRTDEVADRQGTDRVSLQEPMSPGSRCPTCGKGEMRARPKARFRPIVGCSLYPQCKTTAPMLSLEK
ncbi:UvrD-helicase domain-containing protein [Sphingopyxis sp. H115]|uniref:UvrD-helicase domain-containing protein n=1 Tax=Sphingopyxis sp. H115 TaxID=1759073 RepID=UPI000736E6EA|nr:UvrD-helicase domain-containing protein [Sphingopyxis sp. H115]KTE17557.1 hypothetical protein ATE71_00005 [Sphingopyxis sp. H115]